MLHCIVIFYSYYVYFTLTCECWTKLWLHIGTHRSRTFSLNCDNLHLYQHCTPRLCNTFPFFHVKLFKLSQIGRWPLVKCNLKSFHRFSMGCKSGIWLGHARTFTFFLLQPQYGQIAWVLRFTVILIGEPSSHFLMSRMLWYFCTIHCSYCDEFPSLCSGCVSPVVAA